jgi:hypothetical protein
MALFLTGADSPAIRLGARTLPDTSPLWESEPDLDARRQSIASDGGMCLATYRGLSQPKSVRNLPNTLSGTYRIDPRQTCT